jgi:hypothetical protein
LGGTVSGIGGSESDITAISLRGKAEYFEDDFQIDILSIFDVPSLYGTSYLHLVLNKNPQRRLA